MNVVYEEVKKLVYKELTAATERFGLHHSWYEKYAVMLDEFEELENEVRCAKDCLSSVWFGVKNHLEDYAEEYIPKLYDRAVKSACEAIQVASMAKKEIYEIPDNGTAEISDHGTYTGKDDLRVLHCDACRNDFVSTIRSHPHFCPDCGAEFTNVLRF